MNLLLVGPASPINKGIAERLCSDPEATLFWLVAEDDHYPTKEDEETSSAFNISFQYFKREDSDLAKLLKSLDQGVSFKGIVYGEGIGGVRPAKLNSKPFLETMFQANVFRFFELISTLQKQKRINPGASILTLSSVSSIKGLKSKSAYSASKAALDAAVRGIAAELAPQGIRVNSIQKGWVTSDMDLDFIRDNRILTEDSDLKKQVLGPIDPQELANLVVFLLSDQVKTITGTSIVLDGGYSL